ncbi:MAG: UDP-N-acetylmuramate--L-alanine ligase [Candidatus Dormibacteria bacterium]
MSRHVHLLGICGYAVSGAALMAQQLGYAVTGSDEDAYPPTSDILTAAGIRWVNAHSAANVLLGGRPDLVVVGNQVRPGNVEWAEAVRLGIPVTSEAEFYGELTEGRVRAAVCGTHGKTTTSSLLAWILESAGLDPGFRLGTTSRDFAGISARLGRGAFVFEGDEYTTAPWDARPKFLHVHPEVACVTRLELDHPDVYPSFEAYREPFRLLAMTMPSDGLLVLCADDPECRALRSLASCEVLSYGFATDADLVLREARERHGRPPEEPRLHLKGAGIDVELELTMPGAHNWQNAAAAVLMARRLGAERPSAWAQACAGFRGPSRRFELVGEPSGIIVIDDYAHHPTEVAATVTAARGRYPDARIFAAYVPHTYSRTSALLEDYAHSFVGSDVVLLGPIEPARERHLEGTVSSDDIKDRVRGVEDVRVVADAAAVIAAVAAEARPGDVVLCMSVRGFDDLARRLAGALRSAHAG